MHQICLPPFFLYAAFLYNIYFHFKLSLYFQHPVFGILHKVVAYGPWLGFLLLWIHIYNLYQSYINKQQNHLGNQVKLAE